MCNSEVKSFVKVFMDVDAMEHNKEICKLQDSVCPKQRVEDNRKKDAEKDVQLFKLKVLLCVVYQWGTTVALAQGAYILSRNGYHIQSAILCINTLTFLFMGCILSTNGCNIQSASQCICALALLFDALILLTNGHNFECAQALVCALAFLFYDRILILLMNGDDVESAMILMDRLRN